MNDALGKIEKVTDLVGRAHGHRAIVFHFTTNRGHRSATVDFLSAPGSAFEGRRYCEVEAAALRSVIATGVDVSDYSHTLVF